MKTKNTTPAAVVEATAKHYGINPDRIRHYKKQTSQDYLDKVPRATTIAQGLSRALGNNAQQILDEIPRKNDSGINNAYEKLDWNVRVDRSWREDVTAILRAL